MQGGVRRSCRGVCRGSACCKRARSGAGSPETSACHGPSGSPVGLGAFGGPLAEAGSCWLGWQRLRSIAPLLRSAWPPIWPRQPAASPYLAAQERVPARPESRGAVPGSPRSLGGSLCPRAGTFASGFGMQAGGSFLGVAATLGRIFSLPVSAFILVAAGEGKRPNTPQPAPRTPQPRRGRGPGCRAAGRGLTRRPGGAGAEPGAGQGGGVPGTPVLFHRRGPGAGPPPPHQLRGPHVAADVTNARRPPRTRTHT